jgi:hypothetical protein
VQENQVLIISLNPDTGRWYLDASWTTAPGPAPGLGELRAHPVVAVDVNAGHLAACALTPDGNRRHLMMVLREYEDFCNERHR